MIKLPLPLVGDELLVPCIDQRQRPYLSLDAAASTGALEEVQRRVVDIPIFALVFERSPRRRV